MKTSPLPSRPANVPAPPEGYVYLGVRTDINVPDSWDYVDWGGSKDLLDYAVVLADEPQKWQIMRAKYGTSPLSHYAAQPDTPLYNLNKDRLPVDKPTAPVKTLKYKVVTRQNGLVAVQITEQSHLNEEFGEKGKRKFGKLESANSPENAINTYRATFFVRGNRPSQHNELMLFTSEQFDHFEKEVAAYNLHFSKPPILRTVVFKYSGGSIRSYRKVEVLKEDADYIEGTDCDKGEYRRYLKSKIVGKIDEIKT